MKSDLGRILRATKHVTIDCHARGCDLRRLAGERMTKPAAIRVARIHAAHSGHTVRLWIEHYQDVEPKGDPR